MNPDQELPPISTSPTDQHGQIMYALGLINGELKGIQQRQDTTNGKVLKATDDIVKLKEWQSGSDGGSMGMSTTWLILGNVVTLIIAAIGLYLAIARP